MFKATGGPYGSISKLNRGTETERVRQRQQGSERQLLKNERLRKIVRERQLQKERQTDRPIGPTGSV